jgi:hypothetical protein
MINKVLSGVAAATILVTGAAQVPHAAGTRSLGSGNGSGTVQAASATGGIRWGKPVAVENFSGTKLNLKRWYVYDAPDPKPGQPRRSPKAVHVRNGSLELVGHIDGKLGDISGGIGDRVHQTYGRRIVRFRASVGRGYAPVALLWPQDGN